MLEVRHWPHIPDPNWPLEEGPLPRLNAMENVQPTNPCQVLKEGDRPPPQQAKYLEGGYQPYSPGQMS